MSKNKKKKGGHAGKKDEIKLQHLDLSQMIEQGSHFLNTGKPRDAIPLFKAALKTGEADEQVRNLLYRTYLLRAIQLRAKGMITEAGVVQGHALALLPSPAHLSEPNLLLFLETADLETAAKYGCTWLKANPPSPAIVLKMAGILVMSEKWAFLDGLSKESGLVSDAEPVKQALDWMKAGDWQAAFDVLKSMARSSPYTPVRLLCHAMTCFYKEDDVGMRRALAMFPADSPLYPLAEALRHDPRQLSCLWDRTFFSEADVRTLLAALPLQPIKQAAAAIRRFCETIYPPNPPAAAWEMLQCLWPLTLRNSLTIDRFRRLAEELLSKSEAKLVLAKIDYYHFDRTITDTVHYLNELDTEFPIEDQKKKAASLILVHTVARIQQTDLYLPSADHWPEAYHETLGIASEEPELYLIDMLLKAIELDPLATRAYQLLAKQPRSDRAAKNKVESGLKKMTGVFVEDPFPCLALADLYYEKNAFRKAENVLDQAKQRAPHDPRVLDRHVLSLLISADRRMRGNKLHLAAEDLEKAQELCGDRTLPLVAVKKFLFEREQIGQLSLFEDTAMFSPKEWHTSVQNAVSPLKAYQRLNTLGLLAVDLAYGQDRRSNDYLRQLRKVLNYFQKDIQKLTSKEIRSLLVPLPKELQPVVHSLNRAGIYVKCYPTILHLIDDADVVPVLDAMVAESLFKEMEKEIRRRLKQAANRLTRLLEFYLVTVRHLSEEVISDAAAFKGVVQKAAGDEKEALRAAARRLAAHASGRLQSALKEFDFDLLARPAPFFGKSGNFYPDDDIFPLDDDEDDDDIDDDLCDFFNMLDLDKDINPIQLPAELLNAGVQKLVNKVEEIIRQAGLRGMPGHTIRGVRDQMKKDISGPWMFDLLAELLSKDQINRLSREAWEFICGKE